MLTINQFVDNVLETFLPLFTVYAKSNSIEKNIKKKDIDESSAKILWENKLSEYEVNNNCLVFIQFLPLYYLFRFRTPIMII